MAESPIKPTNKPTQSSKEKNEIAKIHSQTVDGLQEINGRDENPIEISVLTNRLKELLIEPTEDEVDRTNGVEMTIYQLDRSNDDKDIAVLDFLEKSFGFKLADKKYQNLTLREAIADKFKVLKPTQEQLQKSISTIQFSSIARLSRVFARRGTSNYYDKLDINNAISAKAAEKFIKIVDSAEKEVLKTENTELISDARLELKNIKDDYVRNVGLAPETSLFTQSGKEKPSEYKQALIAKLQAQNSLLFQGDSYNPQFINAGALQNAFIAKFTRLKQYARLSPLFINHLSAVTPAEQDEFSAEADPAIKLDMCASIICNSYRGYPDSIASILSSRDGQNIISKSLSEFIVSSSEIRDLFANGQHLGYILQSCVAGIFNMSLTDGSVINEANELEAKFNSKFVKGNSEKYEGGRNEEVEVNIAYSKVQNAFQVEVDKKLQTFESSMGILKSLIKARNNNDELAAKLRGVFWKFLQPVNKAPLPELNQAIQEFVENRTFKNFSKILDVFDSEVRSNGEYRTDFIITELERKVILGLVAEKCFDVKEVKQQERKRSGFSTSVVLGLCVATSGILSIATGPQNKVITGLKIPASNQLTQAQIVDIAKQNGARYKINGNNVILSGDLQKYTAAVTAIKNDLDMKGVNYMSSEYAKTHASKIGDVVFTDSSDTIKLNPVETFVRNPISLLSIVFSAALANSIKKKRNLD